MNFAIPFESEGNETLPSKYPNLTASTIQALGSSSSKYGLGQVKAITYLPVI